MWALVRSRTFDRRLAKFVRRHPDLRGRLADVFLALEQDPFQPRLRLHPLRGELSELHAVSVTYSDRIVLRLQIAGREVVLLDIGSHDDVYR